MLWRGGTNADIDESHGRKKAIGRRKPQAEESHRQKKTTTDINPPSFPRRRESIERMKKIRHQRSQPKEQVLWIPAFAGMTELWLTTYKHHRPQPTVIPAKAGIHRTRENSTLSAQPTQIKGSMDSRFRGGPPMRNDGVEANDVTDSRSGTEVSDIADACNQAEASDDAEMNDAAAPNDQADGKRKNPGHVPDVYFRRSSRS